jgi:opacity protein-like surface antigen
MLNGYKDIITVGRFTPFIGGGIGINSLKNKSSGALTDPDVEFLIVLKPSSSPIVHQFVYKLTAGTDIKLNDSITSELSYNFFNLGNNRSSVSEGSDSIVKRNYYVHNITAGIRFNF